MALAALAWPAPSLAACAGHLVADGAYAAPVCLPEAPQRIVTLEPWLTLGTLSDLGVPVIGVPVIGIQDPDLRRQVEADGVADLGHPVEPSLERIVALQPDLIIGSSYMHAQIHEILTQVAPTLLIDQMGWKDHILLLAEATGRWPEAQEMLARYETRAQAIRDAVPEDLRLSVVRIARAGFQVYLDGPGAYGPYAVLSEAGVRRTAWETTTDDRMLKRPDWEEIAALDGDILLYVAVAGVEDADDDRLTAETLAHPLWQALPAVAAGRSYRVDRSTWMAFRGLVSAHLVLDDVERYVLGRP